MFDIMIFDFVLHLYYICITFVLHLYYIRMTVYYERTVDIFICFSNTIIIFHPYRPMI